LLAASALARLKAQSKERLIQSKVPLAIPIG
jgi:hypothetical protein